MVNASTDGEKSIRTILLEIISCIAMGDEYTGEFECVREDATYLVPLNLPYMQTIANCTEQRFGIELTLEIVNDELRKDGRTEIERSCLYHAIKRLNPVVTKIKSQSQGSKSVTSDWAKAWLAWVTQLLIRLGKYDDADLEKLKVNGVLPDMYNIEKLGKLELNQICWWDETHKKVKIGAGGDYQTRIRRDKDGNIDLINGQLRDEDEINFKMKYEKECRLLLGVGLDQNNVGKQLPLFSYTGQRVVSITEWERAVEQEI